MLSVALVALGGCSGGGGDSANSASPTNPSSGNSPPSISGNPPASTKIGESYSFRPQASDPDGDQITFSIQNKPSWANFNSATGQLSGTPQAGDEGTYSNVRIIASDGSATDSLSFAVTVTQVGTGSVTLSWTPPTQNTDGTALTNLAGYKIYYGTRRGQYSSEISIDNPGITTYVVDNLSPNTYYFVSTAVNSGGIESDYSNEAVKTVN